MCHYGVGCYNPDTEDRQTEEMFLYERVRLSTNEYSAPSSLIAGGVAGLFLHVRSTFASFALEAQWIIAH